MNHRGHNIYQRKFVIQAFLVLTLLFSMQGSVVNIASAQTAQPQSVLAGTDISSGPSVVAIHRDGSVAGLPDVPTPAYIEPGLNDPVFLKTPPGLAPTKIDAPVAPNMPTPTINFEGIKLDDNCGGSNCGGGFPPDTVGDVGPSHYIAAVNTAVAIYNKTGTQLALFSFNQLWNGAASGTYCDANNEGDPTVVYDPIGDRWIIADFAFTSASVAPFYECIAVSKTNDPVNGGWYLYAIRGDDASHVFFPDYPKMGVWTDALYMTANMFNSALTFAEVRVWAFNRQQLESGTATSIIIDTNSNARFSFLPATLRGTRPPDGRDEFLVAESTTLYAYEVYKFHTDWVTPANSTFTGPTNVTQTSYTVPGTVIPQPGTATRLDSLGERMMMQAQYTHIGADESLWVAHTTRVSAAGVTAVQWAQINVTSGTVNTTPVQEQFFTNGSDGLYRWVPSIAADHQGDAAVGYSASNGTNTPSIRFAGRLVTDPLSTLGQGETVMLPWTDVTSTGNMNFNCGLAACTRWGDYSAMNVDPVDNCTFWYVNEYYPAPNGSSTWHTRIAAFSFPSCTPYISFKANGPDRHINPGYGWDVTLATADATQKVCLRWSTNGGTSWAGSAVCTYNAGTGKWTCNMPANISSATITYQFWIGAAADNCAVTGNETLWSAYNTFATNPTDVQLASLNAAHTNGSWLWLITTLAALLLGGFAVLRRKSH